MMSVTGRPGGKLINRDMTRKAMAKKKKVDWKTGDIFLVPLLDGTYGTGQILDLQMPTIVRIALFDENVKSLTEFDISHACSLSNLISLIASSREQLDFDAWKIVGNKPIQIAIRDFPNEQFRNKDWVGAKHYDAALIEDFLNAFYSFIPWDDWFNPNYLDAFLVDLSKKPKTLVFIKS